MVRSTFSTSNMHKVIDDKSNIYRNMVMDAMKMDQGHADQCSIMDEKPNAKATKLFYLFKDSDEPL